jgi:putative hemolysin
MPDNAYKNSKFINLKAIIASKSPALARYLPGFLHRYLKRIVHEDEVNSFISTNGHLKDHTFVAAVFKEFGAEARVQGLENIPLSGGCIVAANHPLGGLDGIGLMKVVGQRRPDIRFFVNDILLSLQNFSTLFVGVNKHGKNPKENLRLMEDVFASENCVLFFPAGLVSRRQNGVIADLEWQKSYIAKAIKYQKPIVPAFIGGQNSNFFYNLSNWRKKLGIQANVEMLYLVDEMYRQNHKTLDFIFGEPIPHTVFNKERKHDEWAQKMKAYVYALSKGEKRNFETFCAANETP